MQMQLKHQSYSTSSNQPDSSKPSYVEIFIRHRGLLYLGWKMKINKERRDVGKGEIYSRKDKFLEVERYPGINAQWIDRNTSLELI